MTVGRTFCYVQRSMSVEGISKNHFCGQGDLLWTSETAVFCNGNLKYPLKEGDVISQYTATSKRVNQMGHHKKSRRQIMGLWPVLPTDSVKLVFTRIPTFLSKKGIKLFRGIFRCFQIFKTVSKLFGYFQMVSKLSRRFQNCLDLSGWL